MTAGSTNELYFWLFAAAIAAGAWVFVKFKSAPLLERVLIGVVPAAMVAMGLYIYSGTLHLPNWLWNGARLTPAFAMRHGLKLYSMPGEGPALDFFYGPLSAVAYLPATFFQTPSSAIVAGGLLNVAYSFVPVLWLLVGGHWRSGRAWLLASAAIACYFAFATGSKPLIYSFFSVHSDAPSLAWSACACAVLVPHQARGSTLRYRLSAVLTVLALWTKLVVAVLPLAIVCYLAVADGRRAAVTYIVSGLVAGAVVSGVLFSVFDAKALFFALVMVSMNVSARMGPQFAPWIAWQQMIQEMVLPTIVLAMFAPCTWERQTRAGHGRWTAFRAWCAQNRWTLVLTVGIFMIPLAVPHRYGSGGDDNALSPPLYFLAAATAMVLVQVAINDNDRHSRLLQVGSQMVLTVGLVSLLVIRTPPPTKIAQQLQAFPSNVQSVVYKAAKENPGMTYFPDFPLAVLMAEGKLYHFSYGMIDYERAGYPLSDEQFRAYFPTNAVRVVLLPFWVKETMQHLPEFRRQVEVPSGWQMFEKG